MIDFFTGPRYTEDELMARLKFFIGVILGLTLFGIVFVVLYSLIFVTQPMNGMSPVDNKFFELIIPIATFLVGTLSGIMLAGGDKDLRAKALESANKAPPPPAPASPSFGGSRPGFNASFNSGSGFNASVNVPFTKKAEPQMDLDDDLNIRRPMSANDVPSFQAGINQGFGGRPAPVQPPQPEI